jgi:acyl transferase domain-containing protein
MLLQGPEVVGTYTATGLASTMVANRVSYLLNLQGPSLTVDTACSSSLVAVHLACQSLWNGESNLALAGGVNLMLTPTVTVSFSKLTALSPEGRCKAFDAAANALCAQKGWAPWCSNASARPWPMAIALYALIRAAPPTRMAVPMASPLPTQPPRRRGQGRLRAGGHSPQPVDYIEAHGTGTLLGDPIEAKALGNVFGPFRELEQPVRLGSVKAILAIPRRRRASPV